MLTLEVALRSERGGRDYNEDACGHWHSEAQLCCVLADGAGGHGGGEIAARMAVGHIIQGFSTAPTADGVALNALLRNTSQTIIANRVPDTSSAQMHSTVVCLVIDFVAQQAHWAHAGDSRLYWFRQGSVHLQTRDHSMVQSLVDAGLLEAGQLRVHPKRSQLNSALGTEDADLQVTDSGAAEAVEPGDVFLLCTDGLWEHVTELELEQTLTDAATPQAWLDRIADLVTAATHASPNHDNFSALTVWTQAAE